MLDCVGVDILVVSWLMILGTYFYKKKRILSYVSGMILFSKIKNVCRTYVFLGKIKLVNFFGSS